MTLAAAHSVSRDLRSTQALRALGLQMVTSFQNYRKMVNSRADQHFAQSLKTLSRWPATTMRAMQAALLLLAAWRHLPTFGLLLAKPSAKPRLGRWRWLTPALPMQRPSLGQKASLTARRSSLPATGPECKQLVTVRFATSRLLGPLDEANSLHPGLIALFGCKNN